MEPRRVLTHGDPDPRLERQRADPSGTAFQADQVVMTTLPLACWTST